MLLEISQKCSVCSFNHFLEQLQCMVTLSGLFFAKMLFLMSNGGLEEGCVYL